MRYSIKELLIVVAVCAFASVSLVKLNPIYVSLFFSFTLLMIGAAILFSIATVGSRRFFWIGFAVLSSLYMYFAHMPDENGDFPRRSGREVSTFLLQVAFDKIHWPYFNPTATNVGPGGGGGFGGVAPAPNSGGGVFSIPDNLKSDDPVEEESFDPLMTDDVDSWVEVQFSGGGGSGRSVNPGVMTASGGSLTDFMLVGHSFFALLLGWNAGHTTRFVYERSRQKSEKTGPVSTTGSQSEGDLSEPNPF